MSYVWNTSVKEDYTIWWVMFDAKDYSIGKRHNEDVFWVWSDRNWQILGGPFDTFEAAKVGYLLMG